MTGISRRSLMIGAAAGAGALALGTAGQASAATFGGLGTFFWEPAGYPPFTGYGSTAWESNRRPTAAMDGFLNV